jgi:hypothetical protein
VGNVEADARRPRVRLIVGAALIAAIVAVTGVVVSGRIVASLAPQPADAAPTVCSDDCFDGTDIGGTLGSDADFAALGITENLYAWGQLASSTPTAEHRWSSRRWERNAGSPEACYFTNNLSPVALPLAADPGFSDEFIYFTGARTTESNGDRVNQTVRIFTSSAEAEQYLGDLETQIDGCSRVTFDAGPRTGSATVSASAPLEVPGSVATVGWVEAFDSGLRYYAFDLQRGNIVVRMTFLLESDLAESTVRDFTTAIALKLAALEAPGEVT